MNPLDIILSIGVISVVAGIFNGLRENNPKIYWVGITCMFILILLLAGWTVYKVIQSK